MSKIVGIDLGTTNYLVATVDSGIPLVIADAQGRRLLPSVVYYPQRATASANSSPGHKDGYQKGYAKTASIAPRFGRRAAI